MLYIRILSLIDIFTIIHTWYMNHIDSDFYMCAAAFIENISLKTLIYIELISVDQSLKDSIHSKGQLIFTFYTSLDVKILKCRSFCHNECRSRHCSIDFSKGVVKPNNMQITSRSSQCLLIVHLDYYTQ